MSLYVVEREEYIWRPRRGPAFPLSWGPVYVTVPVVRYCNEHDGEWPAFITLPYEHVEHEGYGVPVFEGDVERQEWEAAQ